MADKQNTEKKIKVSAGKATDAAAGKITSPAGAGPEAVPPTKFIKKGKILSKNKHRLPRRQKKANRRLQVVLTFAEQ
jgi:hypothetical protein